MTQRKCSQKSIPLKSDTLSWAKGAIGRKNVLRRGLFVSDLAVPTQNGFPYVAPGSGTISQTLSLWKAKPRVQKPGQKRDAAVLRRRRSILWITFIGERLCWGLLTPSPPERHFDGDGVWRTVAEWVALDRYSGRRAYQARLSGIDQIGRLSRDHMSRGRRRLCNTAGLTAKNCPRSNVLSQG